MSPKVEHAPIDPFEGIVPVAWFSQEELQMLQPPKAKEEEEEDDDEEDDDEEDDDEEEDDDDPAELRRQLDEANARLKRAGKKIGKLKKAPVAAPEPVVKKKAKAADDDGPDVEELVSNAVKGVQAQADLRAKKAGLKSLLKEAGVDSGGVALLVGVAKFDDLEIDDEGDLDGAEDVIDELRQKYPSLFATKTKRPRRINGKDDKLGDEKGDKKPMTATEAQSYKIQHGEWPRGFKPPTK